MLRKRKIFVLCPKCNGHKGIYGKSQMGHPATLPCDRCDAVGEVNLESLTDAEKTQDTDKAFYNSTKMWGW